VHGEYEKSLREKVDTSIEFRVALPSGAAKHIQAIQHPVLNEAGDVVELVGTAIDITERKQAEDRLRHTAEALRRSEAYLAEAQRLSHTGSWARDIASGKYVYLSEECFRIFELDAHEGLPNREAIIRYVHPEDRDRVQGTIEKSAWEKVDTSIEYRIVLPDGTVKNIHSIGHPILNDAGDVVQVVGTVVDITERKRAEEKIRQQEMELRQILDFTPHLVGVFDVGREHLYASRPALDYLGLTLEEWKGKSDPFWLFHPDDRERVEKDIYTGAASEVPHEFEARLRRKDGTYRWFLFRDSPLRNEQGRITRWYLSATDIEERKRAEEVLRVASAYNRSLIEASLDPLVTIDPEGRITDVNAATEQVTGYTRSELIATDFSDYFTEPEKARAGYQQVFHQGFVRDYELKIRHRDGRITPVLYNASVYWDEAGTVIGVFAAARDITERKRAEEEINKTEDRFRMLIETMNEGFGVQNEKGVWTYLNDQLCWMLGHLPADIIGHPVTKFLDEANQSVLEEEIQRERKGNYSPYEITWTRGDGRKVTTIVSAKPIFNPESQVKEVFAVFTDITERKQMEDRLRQTIEALRRSEAYLAEAQRLSRTGSWARNPAGDEYDYWSEETFRIWGFDPQQPPPKYSTLADRVHPEDLDRVIEMIETAQREEKDYDLQLRIVLPDGTIKHIHIIGHNVFSESGELITRIGTVVDITERKRAEAEINNLKNYLSNIINSMPSILVGMDSTRTVTQWNRQAEAFTGIPPEEAIGKPIIHLLPEFSTWIAIMGADMDIHRPSSMEKLLIEKEGERRFYDLMLYPLIVDSVGGAVLRIEDVTEKARIQELMVQTEKMMSIGGLAAGMSHEINNPLGIITQAAQNIERRISLELPANRKVAEELGLNLEGIRAYFEKRQISDAIASIRMASSRAAKIVANMLQFSRRADTTMEFTSLTQIIDQALELAASDYDLKKNYDFRSINIVKDYQETPQVRIVSVEIEQVILNLLKNAAQAMTANPPDAKPRITLRLYREDGYAVIEVEDNGPGIKEDILARVFEPFFTTKEPGAGTGLGLSVSYMVVTQNHKGFMEAHSKPGRGAVFKVRLPIERSKT
jgi:PAS domain S-box-containing protein